MQWLRTHAYTILIGGAGILVVLGAFVISSKTPIVPQRSQTIAWGGAGTILTPSSGAPADNTQQQGVGSIMEQMQNGSSGGYVLSAPQTISPDNSDTSAASGGFDFNAFIATLTNENAATTSVQSGTTVSSNAYSFIPTGLVSIATPKTRTKLQQSLYEYGNDAGSFIQSFEQDNPNESQVLWDQAQDRTDAGKAAALITLAQSLSGLGGNLLAMDNVPTQMTDAHAALAASYQELGKKLALVPQTKSDADFIAAINTYNTAAQTFTKNYVALANLFVVYGVTFSPADEGSVFTFTNSAGL